MSTAAAGALARGPLSSAVSQWALIGLGAYTILGPDKVRSLVMPLLIPDDGDNKHRNNTNGQNSLPIIIQTGNGNSNSGNNKSLVTTIITYTVGAGCVWIVFGMISNIAMFEQYFPVTRKVFDKATAQLQSSLSHVKEVLGKQILSLIQKTDNLYKKQDDMHNDINDLQNDMKQARTDLIGMVESLERCESGIERNEDMQSYTLRGVKLLVTAVSSILPGNDRITKELQDYARDGHTNKRLQSTTTRSNSNDSLGGGTPEAEHPQLTAGNNLPQMAPASRSSSTSSSSSSYGQNNNNQDNDLNDLIAMIRDNRVMEPVR